MTRRDDDRTNPPLGGAEGARTGFDAPDVKDAHQDVYATTPPEDRVGAADHGSYTPVVLPPAREVTGAFDHLATRDVAAMEEQLQTPDFEGAETVAGLGNEQIRDLLPSAGIGVGVAPGEVVRSHLAEADLNPGYTPPSSKVPPHVSERPGDLPPGEPAELQNEVRGDGTEPR